MLIRFFKNSILVVGVGLLQVSLIPNLGVPFVWMQFVVVSLVFAGMLFNFKRAIVLGVFFGVLIDLFSDIFFTANVIGLVVTFFVLRWVFNKFFTNKSLYTIVFLITLATVAYHYVMNGLRFVYYLIQNGVMDYGVLGGVADSWQVGGEVLMSTVVGSVIFVMYYYSSNSFHSAVLGR